MSDIREAIATGLAALDDLYVEAIRTYAPPNPQFERDRIIRSLINKREIAYVCGFLSEGENEAALIFGLIRELLDVDPNAEIGHLLHEARYYLRTSVDPEWQLEAETPALATALRYLAIVVARRIARAAQAQVEPPLAELAEPDARALLLDREGSTPEDTGSTFRVRSR